MSHAYSRKEKYCNIFFYIDVNVHFFRTFTSYDTVKKVMEVTNLTSIANVMDPHFREVVRDSLQKGSAQNKLP